MAKTQTIDSAGNVTITEQLPDNPNGTKATRSWQFRADQAGAHEKTLGADLSPGDHSALLDVAAEAAKKK